MAPERVRIVQKFPTPSVLAIEEWGKITHRSVGLGCSGSITFSKIANAFRNHIRRVGKDTLSIWDIFRVFWTVLNCGLSFPTLLLLKRSVWEIFDLFSSFVNLSSRLNQLDANNILGIWLPNELESFKNFPHPPF